VHRVPFKIHAEHGVFIVILIKALYMSKQHSHQLL